MKIGNDDNITKYDLLYQTKQWESRRSLWEIHL